MYIQGRQAKNNTFSPNINHNLTNHNETQPGGELLLGLFTLLTMHHVYAERRERKSNPKRLNNPTAI